MRGRKKTIKRGEIVSQCQARSPHTATAFQQITWNGTPEVWYHSNPLWVETHHLHIPPYGVIFSDSKQHCLANKLPEYQFGNTPISYHISYIHILTLTLTPRPNLTIIQLSITRNLNTKPIPPENCTSPFILNSPPLPPPRKIHSKGGSENYSGGSIQLAKQNGPDDEKSGCPIIHCSELASQRRHPPTWGGSPAEEFRVGPSPTTNKYPPVNLSLEIA